MGFFKFSGYVKEQEPEPTPHQTAMKDSLDDAWQRLSDAYNMLDDACKQAAKLDDKGMREDAITRIKGRLAELQGEIVSVTLM